MNNFGCGYAALGMGDFVSAFRADELPQGRGRTVRIHGIDVAFFNLGGEFYAIDGTCPHRGGPLGEGWVEDGKVYCPMHGWCFEIMTGACLSHPFKGAIKQYATRVANGTVEVEISSKHFSEQDKL